MMAHKIQLMGIVVREILKRTDEFYEDHDHEPISWSKLKGIVGRRAINAGGFETIIQALLEDRSIRLVTLTTGKRFIAPGTCDVGQIKPVRFTVKPS